MQREQSKSVVISFSSVSVLFQFIFHLALSWGCFIEKEKAHWSRSRPRCTWLWGHCRWLKPNQAFNFHLTYWAQGENENRASFHFISTRKLELSSQLEYIKDLFSYWLQGCDRLPAEGLLIDMDVERTVTVIFPLPLAKTHFFYVF